MKDADVTTIKTENMLKNRGPGFLRKRFGLIGSAIILLFLAWAIWSWGFCRFYVGPGQMAIITAKSGEDRPAGQILAKPGQKGPLEDVLGEGRHIWNPIFYDWEIVEAQFIPPGKVGIVTSLAGDALPPGEFLAEPGQKGIWRKVLGPGMYRFNPVGYIIDIVDAVSIPLGFAGVVTNLSGADDKGAEGRAAFAGAGQKGVRADVLQPGLYFINPREYIVEALEVGVNQVSLVGEEGGVVLTKNVSMDENNQMIQRLNQSILEEQKRRRDEYQQAEHAPLMASTGRPPRPRRAQESVAEELMDDPGAYARRAMSKSLPASRAPGPSQGKAMAMEKDIPPAFVLDQFVNFPSRDGFDISLDLTVEFELRPEHLALIKQMYGDLPQMVEKTLMPQVLSVSRNTGSGYRAVDFIAGEGREKFQNDLTDSLKTSLGEKNILIHSALIRNVNVPDQILEPLRVASLSKETDLTNKEKQNTAKKQAELNSEMSLIKQFGEQVMQETAKMKAEIDADMTKTVAMIQADTIRQQAAIQKQTATVRASKTIALGEAEASALSMVESERARGFGLKVKAFGRDGEEYALYEFAMRLNPELRINLIHAGPGTLWTDLKNATLADIGGAEAVGKR